MGDSGRAEGRCSRVRMVLSGNGLEVVLTEVELRELFWRRFTPRATEPLPLVISLAMAHSHNKYTGRDSMDVISRSIHLYCCPHSPQPYKEHHSVMLGPCIGLGRAGGNLYHHQFTQVSGVDTFAGSAMLDPFNIVFVDANSAKCLFVELEELFPPEIPRCLLSK